MLFLADYLISQGKALKLDAAGQPPGLKQWLTTRKELDRIPSKVDDSSQFYRELVAWYRSLLPPSRRSIWPPPRDAVVEPADWLSLSKSTANGFFLLLVSASWLPSLEPPIPKDDICALVDEFIWSLEQMVSCLKENVVSAGKKRKNTGKVPAPTKKKRTR